MSETNPTDGAGQPPSEAVTKATAPFFDDTPPPHDPKLARQIAERIAEREKNIPWKQAAE